MRERVDRFMVYIGGRTFTDFAFVVAICASFAQFVNSLVEVIIPILRAVAGPPNIARLTFTINNSADPYSAVISSLTTFLVVVLFISGLTSKPTTRVVAWVTPNAGEMQPVIRPTASASSSWMPGRFELHGSASRRAVARYLNATSPLVGD